MKKHNHQYFTKIWHEKPSSINPYQTAQIFVHGYNLVDQILQNATIEEYHGLLYSEKKLNQHQVLIYKDLQLLLAHLGPRNLGVRAAMNAGVGGGTPASALISSISILAGTHGGAKEVYYLVDLIYQCKNDLSILLNSILSLYHNNKDQETNLFDHPFGFESEFDETSPINLDIIVHLIQKHDIPLLKQIFSQLKTIELQFQGGISLTFIFAILYYYLDFPPESAEMNFLISHLHGSAAHAIEQKKQGLAQFPFLVGMIANQNDVEIKEKINLKDFGI